MKAGKGHLQQAKEHHMCKEKQGGKEKEVKLVL